MTPLASDAKTWKRLATDGRYDSLGVSVQFANGDVKQYRLQEDSAKQEWTLRDAGTDVAILHYSLGADGFVSLEGRIATEPVQVHLRPVDLNSLPLFRTR